MAEGIAAVLDEKVDHARSGACCARSPRTSSVSSSSPNVRREQELDLGRCRRSGRHRPLLRRDIYDLAGLLALGDRLCGGRRARGPSGGPAARAANPRTSMPSWPPTTTARGHAGRLAGLPAPPPRLDTEGWLQRGRSDADEFRVAVESLAVG